MQSPQSDSGYVSSESLFRKKRVYLSPDQDLTSIERQRAQDLIKLCDENLPQFFYNRHKPYDPSLLTIVPRRLGEKGGTACPFLVVQCNKRMQPTVRKFFKQRCIQDQLLKNLEYPQFSWITCGPGMLCSELSESSPIFVLDWPSPTEGQLLDLCGLRLRRAVQGGYVYGTLGGVAQICDESGRSALYGLVTAHFATSGDLTCLNTPKYGMDTDQDTESCYSGYSSSSSDISDDDSTYSSDVDADEDFDVEEFELFLESGDDSHSYAQQSLSDVSAIESRWTKAGRVVATSSCIETVPNRDWALIELPPNCLTVADLTASCLVSCQIGAHRLSLSKCASDQSMVPDRRFPVELAVPGRRRLRGILRRLGAHSVIGHGAKMTEVYTLGLAQTPAILIGDSGSWIIDVATRRVCGHLIGLDAFGDAIVMPMQSILDDISESLSASCLDLQHNLVTNDLHPHPQQSNSNFIPFSYTIAHVVETLRHTDTFWTTTSGDISNQSSTTTNENLEDTPSSYDEAIASSFEVECERGAEPRYTLYRSPSRRQLTNPYYQPYYGSDRDNIVQPNIIRCLSWINRLLRDPPDSLDPVPITEIFWRKPNRTKNELQLSRFVSHSKCMKPRSWSDQNKHRQMLLGRSIAQKSNTGLYLEPLPVLDWTFQLISNPRSLSWIATVLFQWTILSLAIGFAKEIVQTHCIDSGVEVLLAQQIALALNGLCESSYDPTMTSTLWNLLLMQLSEDDLECRMVLRLQTEVGEEMHQKALRLLFSKLNNTRTLSQLPKLLFWLRSKRLQEYVWPPGVVQPSKTWNPNSTSMSYSVLQFKPKPLPKLKRGQPPKPALMRKLKLRSKSNSVSSDPCNIGSGATVKRKNDSVAVIEQFENQHRDDRIHHI